jgi:hypothetical protein
MRHITQLIFRRFSTDIISEGRNVLSEMYSLEINAVLGSVNQQYPLNEMDLEKAQNRIASFVLYQLANAQVNDAGVGCGYYDVEGNGDGGGICHQMNDYMFRVCFDGDKGETRRIFVRYLCTQYENSMFEPNKLIAQYRALSVEHLTSYWNRYEKELESTLDDMADDTVHTLNYSMRVGEFQDQIRSDILSFIGEDSDERQ